MTRIDPAELARLVETLGTLAPEPDVPGDVSVALRDASAAITTLVEERGPLVCTGCGSVQTIEQIRAEHPRALSCCPERQMVTQAEARLREIERERDGEREAREKCDRALRMKDEAVGELLHRLHKAGVDCSDLIP